jgi:spore germination protein YaaH
MNKKRIIAFVILIIVVISGISLRNESILNKYFNTYKIIVNNKVLDFDNSFYYDGEDVFVSKKLALEILGDKVYDSKEGIRLYIKRDAFNFFMPSDRLDKIVSKVDTLNIPYEFKDGVKYLPLRLLSEVTYLDYYYNISRDILMIDDMTRMKEFYQVTSNSAKIKMNPDGGGKTLDVLIPNEVIRVIDDGERFKKVITDKCILGYIDTEDVDIVKVEKTFNNNIMSDEKTKWEKNKISSTFVQLKSYGAYENYLGQFKKAPVNHVIPTWFSLRKNGNVLNNCNEKMVKDLHKDNVRVWGLFDNNFDKDLTRSFLNDSKAVDKAIGQIVTYASMYNLDGINLDFENMYLKDSDRFTMFVRKLSDELNQLNMDLSIDVTVPWGSDEWSKVYDRKSLNNYVDYFILMAYDEHWASSPKAGSVASFPWVEKGVSESIKLIDNDKLILALPYYTRIWYDNGSKIKSKAIPIKNMRNHLKDDRKIWLEEEKQYYLEFDKDGSKNMIWFEEEKSLGHKMELVDKYNIKGISSWTFDYGDSGIFKEIKKYIKVKRR